ncbi:MAG: imidazole glycerol phosphate synthase subunit HisH [Bacteroidia bacterium]
MSKKIVIVDYESGNLFSVAQALTHLGADVTITNDVDKIRGAQSLVLPGVGAFPDAKNNLDRLNLSDAVVDFIKSGKSFMGICLGMQLLFEESEEFSLTKGLGIVKGSIKKFQDHSNMRIPQIAWNTIYNSKRTWENSPLHNIKQNEFMYFVHSYYAKPLEENVVLTNTKYHDFEYCSSVLMDNIFATQFHPEKSAVEGLKIFENWIKNLK